MMLLFIGSVMYLYKLHDVKGFLNSALSYFWLSSHSLDKKRNVHRRYRDTISSVDNGLEYIYFIIWIIQILIICLELKMINLMIRIAVCLLYYFIIASSLKSHMKTCTVNISLNLLD